MKIISNLTKLNVRNRTMEWC